MSDDRPDYDPSEQTDPVWALLGEARMPAPDAWFTARTLARCRNAGLVSEPREMILGRVWRWALGSGLGVCLALFLALHLHPAAPAAPAVPNQQSVQEAFEIMATMAPDSDSSSSAPSWQDSSL
jgi:hypothetical protein